MSLKKLILFLTLLFFYPLFAIEYSCEEHQFFLIQKSDGYEHINHKLYLNNITLIKELHKDMWFIEQISCEDLGFKIIVSHRQYNNFTRKSFILIPKNTVEYVIK